MEFENISRGQNGFQLSSYYMSREREKTVLTTTQWHYDTEILLGQKGKTLVTVDGKENVLEAGDIMFILPKESHSLTPKEIPAGYTAVVFNNNLITFEKDHFFQKLITEPLQNGKLMLKRKISIGEKGYAEILKNVKNLCLPVSENKEKIFLSLFALFFSLYQNGYIKEEATKNNVRAETEFCLEFLNKNYHRKINLEEIAQKVHLTKNYLCTVFSKDTGNTIFEVLNEIRIKNAKTQLEYTDLRISEIAYNCGFENIGFFIKKFKEAVGVTPAKFRKERQ